MKHFYETIKHLFESKAFVTVGGLSTFTIGAFLFGGGAHIQLAEFFIKLIATVITGFFGGCAGQLAKHFVAYIKNKTHVARKEQKRRNDKAA